MSQEEVVMAKTCKECVKDCADCQGTDCVTCNGEGVVREIVKSCPRDVGLCECCEMHPRTKVANIWNLKRQAYGKYNVCDSCFNVFGKA